MNGRRLEHPAEIDLALYARGDMGLTSRWPIARHIKKCVHCEHEVRLFQQALEQLKREACQSPDAFERIAGWDRLEREMLGNIGVGLAAGRCIDKVGRKRKFTYRGALLAAGLAALFVGGWMTHIPKEQDEHLANSLRRLMGMNAPLANGTVIETTPDGIAVRAQGATLTIMHPPTAVVSLAGPSSVRARYVDEDTGEVTITSVYGQ